MFLKLFKNPKPIIGMVHLPPLPGSPGWNPNNKLEDIEQLVHKDVESLTDSGIDGLLFENYGDAPFKKDNVTALTISSMTRIILNCTKNVKTTFGINVLRNSWQDALSIASVTNAAFIRVNVLTGAYATDQGLIEGDAYRCFRYRKYLEQHLGKGIKIFADVNTKHGTPLHKQSITDATRDLVDRVGVDCIIVTGKRTGEEPILNDLLAVKKAAGDLPVLVGSGVNDKNINDFYNIADGFIIGTFFKEDNKITNPVDLNKVKKLIEQTRLMKAEE